MEHKSQPATGWTAGNMARAQKNRFTFILKKQIARSPPGDAHFRVVSCRCAQRRGSAQMPRTRACQARRGGGVGGWRGRERPKKSSEGRRQKQTGGNGT